MKRTVALGVALTTAAAVPLLRKRSAGADLEKLSKDALYRRAKKAGVPGRSQMTKDELIDALKEG